MIVIKQFIFNPFGVNTFVLSDETRQCLVVDPACYTGAERSELSGYIAENKLVPVQMVNTHFHIDHILGNTFICETYGLKPKCHVKSRLFWEATSQYGHAFGLKVEKQIIPVDFLAEGDVIRFGNSGLKVLYTPGHADGSISLVNEPQQFVITGDVLFNGSIGRTDLPTGDYDVLRTSILTKLFILSDSYRVYPGHGPETSIGFEKMNNPFL